MYYQSYLVVITIRSFLHSWIITVIVTRVARRVPRVEQELISLPEHLSTPPVFSEYVFLNLCVFCVLFCRCLFVYFLLSVILPCTTLVSSKFSLSIRISLQMKGIIALIEHLLSNFVLCRDLCFTGVYLDQNVFTVCSISCRTGLEKIHLYLGIN